VNPTEKDSDTGATRRLVWSCLLLTAVMAAAFPLFAGYGFWQSGWSGVAAAAVAGIVCSVGALLALLVIGGVRQSSQVPSAYLLGVLFRMGLPLGIGMLLDWSGGPLAEAGVFGMMVVYFLIGLVVETALSLRLINASTQRAARAS
jgi:hypothetical protein